MNSNSLNDLYTFYQGYIEYSQGNSKKKREYLETHVIHTDLSVSDKKRGFIGNLMNRWSVTKWIYRAIFHINLEKSIENVEKIAKKNLSPSPFNQLKLERVKVILYAYTQLLKSNERQQRLQKRINDIKVIGS